MCDLFGGLLKFGRDTYLLRDVENIPVVVFDVGCEPTYTDLAVFVSAFGYTLLSTAGGTESYTDNMRLIVEDKQNKKHTLRLCKMHTAVGVNDE